MLQVFDHEPDSDQDVSLRTNAKASKTFLKEKEQLESGFMVALDPSLFAIRLESM